MVEADSELKYRTIKDTKKLFSRLSLLRNMYLQVICGVGGHWVNIWDN